MQAQLAREALDELESALVGASSVALSCLSPEEVGEWLCDLQGLRARLEALVCTSASEAHHASVQTTGGQRTVAAYVAANTSSDPKVIGADRNLGLWLDAFCEFAEAFHAGALTRRHVQAFRSVDNPRTHTHLVKSQDYLVEAARNCGWAEFEKVLRYWVLAFDPDGDEPTEQVEARRLSLRKRVDGMVKGDFLLDPLAGHAALTAVEQEVQRLFHHDAQTGEQRSHAQRYADALVNLLTRGAPREQGSTPSPLVHIVMSKQVADDTIARLNDDGGRAAGADHHHLPLDPDDVDGRCELIDGTPIHPQMAFAAIVSAVFRRQVFGPDGDIVEVSKQASLFPPHLKQALLVKARGRCEHAGCDAPFAWLQADHVHPRSKGGPTTLLNGQILCDPCNKAKGNREPPQGRDGPAP